MSLGPGTGMSDGLGASSWRAPREGPGLLSPRAARIPRVSGARRVTVLVIIQLDFLVGRWLCSESQGGGEDGSSLMGKPEEELG